MKSSTAAIGLALVCAGCGLLGGSSSNNNNNNNPDMAMPVQKLSLSKRLEDPGNFNAMFFIDPAHGWVGGAGGAVWRIADLGAGGWQKVIATTTPGLNITALFFVDPLHGFAGTNHGNLGTIILETTDGGVTWGNSQILPAAASDVARIFFTDAQHGFAVTGVSTGNIYRTLNGGQSWEVVMGVDFGSTYVQLADITAGPDGTLWVAGSRSQQSKPLLMSSIDGGATWQARESVGELMIFDIDALANGELWLTAFGAIAHSTDASVTWTAQNPDSQSAPTAGVAFADTKRGIAIRGNAAKLYTTNDGGVSWTEMSYTSEVPTYFSDVWVGPDGVGFIVSAGDRMDQGILYSFQLP